MRRRATCEKLWITSRFEPFLRDRHRSPRWIALTHCFYRNPAFSIVLILLLFRNSGAVFRGRTDRQAFRRACGRAVKNGRGEAEGDPRRDMAGQP